MKYLSPILGAGVLLPAALAQVAQPLTVFRTPEAEPRAQLTQYLNKIALTRLQQRRQEISQIKTKEEMERRKAIVREKVLRLIGGLPNYRGPLNVRQVGTLDRGDYRIEKVIYESLPGFYVTANVYVPMQGAGPYPAVLMPVGHSKGGKDGERETAVNLARKGFVVLKYDPIGQGERLQYYDPELKDSKVGGPTTEHSHANGHTMLIGDNVARYRIWDGMRGIDYLVSRKDVDSSKIGCTGCSGGGTLTTYISALDDRVKVAVPACYITSWEELMVKLGPQDAEQTFPNFLKEGLNIADYVEMFAPKPLLILSTIEDFFPLEGARQTFEEAKKIYALYGARDKIGWYIGPGGHGVPLPSREAACEWFIRWFKNGQGDPTEAAMKLDPPSNLWCTKTGQVSTSLGGETVYSLNKKRAAELIPPKQPISSSADLQRLCSRLISDIRSVTAVALRPGGPEPEVKVYETFERDGYDLELISLEPERGIRLPGALMIPDKNGPKPAVIAADPRPKQVSVAAGGELDALAKAGYVVLIIQPRGIGEIGERGGRSVLGDQTMAGRAEVVGKTLVGMRVEDIIRSVDYLVSRSDVDRSKIIGVAQGVGGVPMLHAAVLDDRISQVIVQDTLAAFRLAVEHPLHRGIYDVGIPGVLNKYDLDELLAALAPRGVTVIRPVDALGQPLDAKEFQEICRYAFDAATTAGYPQGIQIGEARGVTLIRYLR